MWLKWKCEICEEITINQEEDESICSHCGGEYTEVIGVVEVTDKTGD